MQDFYILTINPGSTSTKVAIFKNEENIIPIEIKHTAEDLSPFQKVTDQFRFRRKLILEAISEKRFDLNKVQAIVGRGGLIKPVESGVYKVNFRMMRDLINSPIGEHPCNLGGLIAYDISRNLPNATAYIADPVVVDEFEDLARISGHPEFERKSIWHPLNQKAIARHYSSDIKKPYEELNLIVAHLGGGITVGAHKKGKTIDVNNGLDGEGPFSPQRSGTLPIGDVIRMCFSGNFSEKEMLKKVNGKGGINAYLETTNLKNVLEMMNAGNQKAQLIFDALAYQISKEIGALSTVLKGTIDAILLTGGLAYSKKLTDKITSRVKHLASVNIYPGEDEMKALAQNGLMVLRGESEAKTYNPCTESNTTTEL